VQPPVMCVYALCLCAAPAVPRMHPVHPLPSSEQRRTPPARAQARRAAEAATPLRMDSPLREITVKIATMIAIDGPFKDWTNRFNLSAHGYC
jgi:hypothetical protein